VTESKYVRSISSASYDPLKGKCRVLSRIDIELTERCNNRCTHCLINRSEDDTDSQDREMDTRFALDVLKQAADLGCMSVRFTGGEPLLRKDFSELYLAARRLGMRVLLFTNARLITPEIADLFIRVPPGEVMEISVYGMNAWSYDAVAGVKGAFEQFRRGVNILLDRGIPFYVKQALLPQNRHEIEEFEAWATTLPWMTSPPEYAVNFDLRTRRDSAEKNKRISSLRFTPEETVALSLRDPEHLAELREFCSRFLGPQGDRLFSCGAGLSPCIDSYGTAQMCLLLRHPQTVIDLRNASLAHVMVDLFPLLRGKKASNPEYLRRCANCFLKGLCEQCPAKSWTEHGSLDTPVEYLCDVAHAQARSLGLIAEHERAWEIADWHHRVDRFSRGT